MGIEFVPALGMALVCGLAIFALLVLLYALIFRFRDASRACRVALDTIVCALALLLYLPAAFYALFLILMIPLVLFSAPFSLALQTICWLVALTGAFALLWWGLGRVVLLLEKKAQA